MIVTDKFVFVHLPRTGGTFVSEVITKFFPSAREIGHHMPRKFLPKEYAHLPALGTVRNPWEFYVSFYHYILPKIAAGKLVSWMTENGRLGFSGSIQNLLNIGTDDESLDALLEILPEHIDYEKRYIPNVSKEVMSRIRGTGVGYFTFRFNELFGNADEMFICRLETLRQDLIAFFEAIGAATDELRNFVLRSEKKNTAEHRHYSTYYEAGLADLVLVNDRQLIERFGYVFEQETPVETPRQDPF